MKTFALTTLLLITLAALAGCKAGKMDAPAAVVAGAGAQALPRAVVYKMTGDYRDRVPVTLGPGGELASFPGPGDVRGQRLPVALAGGWWLDTRGVSDRSVFTRWTYEQYAALPAPPPVSEIMDSIIPGARVAQARMLPMTPAQALADTAAVNRLVAAFDKQQ